MKPPVNLATTKAEIKKKFIRITVFACGVKEAEFRVFDIAKTKCNSGWSDGHFLAFNRGIFRLPISSLI